MIVEVIGADGRRRLVPSGPQLFDQLIAGGRLTPKSRRHIRRAIRVIENRLGLKHGWCKVLPTHVVEL